MKTSKPKAKLAAIAIAIMGPMMLAPLAHAQFASGSSAPITISADNANYQGAITVLTGGVDVRQGNVRVLADKMTVYSAAAGALDQSDISRIVAQGNFYYLTPEQDVRGNKGVYTRTNDTFVVTGNVIMKQADGNVITGEKLIYNLTTKNAVVAGNCKGRKCGSKGRVNILIKNTQSQNNQGQNTQVKTSGDS